MGTLWSLEAISKTVSETKVDAQVYQKTTDCFFLNT